MCCGNPDNVPCFGTIFPNMDFFHQSAPLVRSPCSPMKIEIAQLSNGALGAAQLIPMGDNQKQRCGSEIARWHYIYTPEECVDEWRQNNADFKLLCYERFHHIRHHVHDGLCTGRHLTSRQFHSLVLWWCPRKILPQTTRPKQIVELCNGLVVD